MRIPAGAWVVVYCPRKDSFLLGKRSRQVKNPERWNLFGGQVEAGESPLQAALRELREESGIRASAGKLRKLDTRSVRCRNSASGLRQMHFYLLTAGKEVSPKLNREHSDYRWFRSGTLPPLVNRPTQVALRGGLLKRATAMGSF